MDTALPQKFPIILDRNLAKGNCTGNRVCTSCDTVVLGLRIMPVCPPKNTPTFAQIPPICFCTPLPWLASPPNLLAQKLPQNYKLQA